MIRVIYYIYLEPNKNLLLRPGECQYSSLSCFYCQKLFHDAFTSDE